MQHVEVKILKIRSNARLPQYMSNLAAGADLFASLDEPVTILPRERAVISCGIAIEMSAFLEAQIRSRSGLALKHGVVVLNSPGTIDADYRGEIGVVLINHGDHPFVVLNGDRIAQMVISYAPMAQFTEVNKLTDTERGDGGFGRTGVRDENGR
jgi:dUTP pyrophosphatase